MKIDTLPDILRRHARERADKVALLYPSDGRSWTFAELQRESNRVAAALTAAGVGAGDRIAYLDKNAPEYFLYLYGGAKLGAVTVAVNWRLAPPEIEYIVNHSEAKVLLVGQEFLPQLSHIRLDNVRQIVVLGDSSDPAHVGFNDWIADESDIDPNRPVAPAETCFQLYTSGTTGLPKGVETTHDNFLSLFNAGHNLYRMTEDTVNLVCMPLFHIAGSGWAVVGQYLGAQTIVLRDVDLGQILTLIPQHRVTHALFVPAVLQALVNTPAAADVDFSSLEIIVYGASPISEDVLARSIALFDCGFMQGYGLTETTGMGALLAPEDHDPGGPRAHLLRSCGKPPADLEVKIVGADGEPTADGTVGEIWIRGCTVMKGYWRNPEATADTITADGWLKTGDAGYLRDGYLYIHDRVKDMIISGGENIYPAEVENALMRHPAVADAAVIGVPSERWGETVKAIVVRRDPALTEDSLMQFCREQLARYKCPTSVDWVDSIPRNPSGKVLKTVLREPYWQGRERRVS
jgi:long-chain acyl-CoA synthetase